MISSEVQVAAQTSVTAEAQPKPPEPTETASAESPAGRFVAGLCQISSSRGPYAVVDTFFMHGVVAGTGSRSLEEAEEHARRLNAWEADEEAAWPLGLS